MDAAADPAAAAAGAAEPRVPDVAGDDAATASASRDRETDSDDALPDAPVAAKVVEEARRTVQRAYGPKESSETQWRTTKTHTQDQMEAVYRELFFAGFPVNPAVMAGRDGGSGGAAPRDPPPFRPFPTDFVRDFFGHYGPIEHFTYDEQRGIGSVSFTSGSDAENCYLAVNLTLLPPPEPHGRGAVPGTIDDDDDDGGDGDGRRGGGADAPSDDSQCHASARGDLGGYLLLYVEFAQYCPFVNPLLLRDEELQTTEVSRHMMRTMPVNSRKLSPHTANDVVAWYQPTEANAAKLERCGPFYPGATPDKPLHAEVMFVMLKPSWFTPARAIPLPRGSRPNAMNAAVSGRSLSGSGGAYYNDPLTSRQVVRVLDLWWEFYQTYMVHKTQPALDRVRHSRYLFAQKPSVVQEIHTLLRQRAGSAVVATSVAGLPRGAAKVANDNAQLPAATVIHRLVKDEVLHSTLSLLQLKWKRLNDPTWSSFLRDLDHQCKVMERNERARRITSGEAVPAPVLEKTAEQLLDEELRALMAHLERREAVEEMLTTPSYVIALNVIDNVCYLRFVRKHKKELERLKAKARGDVDEEEEAEFDRIEKARMRYKGTQGEDEYLYMEIVQTLDGFATSGSASSLMLLGENPKVFRTVKGHLGYDELHVSSSVWSACYGVLRALWVPVLFVAFVVALILKFNYVSTLPQQRAAFRANASAKAYHRSAFTRQQAAADQTNRRLPNGMTREELLAKIRLEPLDFPGR